MTKTKFLSSASALGAVLALGLSAPTLAQQGTTTAVQVDECYAAAGDDEARLSECDRMANAVTAVVSTGSRIRGLPEDAALPVEVLSRETIADRGLPNMPDLLKGITEATSSSGDGTNGATSYGDTQISLRGMGSGRTLALVNGRRLADAVSESNFTQGNAQNVSMVPAAALQQVEVLKDGGTTTYGADAVAGVINFITRRDLNGMEVSAAHRFIKNTGGYTEANVLWGRRNDSGNVLLSISFEHRSTLRRIEREYSDHLPFLADKTQLAGALGPTVAPHTNAGSFAIQLQAPSGVSAFGTTVVPAANGFASISPIADNTSGGIYRYLEMGSIAGTTVNPLFGNTFQSIGTSSTRSGMIRDIGCDELGGFKGFDATQQPVCFQNYAYAYDQVGGLDNYNIFADANLRLTDKIQYHNEFWLYGQRVDVLRGADGLLLGNQGYNHSGLNPWCEPLPAGAPARSTNADLARECGRVALSANAVTTGLSTNAANNALLSAWQTPGFNPAVADYFGRFYNTAGTARGVSEAQFESLVGLPSSFSFPSLGPASGIYNLSGAPVANEFGAFQIPGQQLGRVGFVGGAAGNWNPFGFGGNPAFDYGAARAEVQNYSFRTVQQLKVDFGKLSGVTLDMDVSGTYQRDMTLYRDSGILTDRLQRALNGFATDLNDPDGDSCTAEETRGTRTFLDPDGTGPLVSGTVANVSYTVGSGGGANPADYNSVGFTGFAYDPDGTGPLSASLPYAGNGCYFFNPFSTSTAQNPFQNIQAPLASATGGGHRAGALAPGGDASVGDYQGYSPGYGLANSPGVSRWLYSDRSRRLTTDNIFFDITFNGDFAGLALPGGALGWAGGTQWRYVRREVQYDRLSDRSATPCPYRTGATVGDPVFSGEISGSAANSLLRREDASTCSALGTNGVGPWADGYGGNNDYRTTRTVSYFGELALPISKSVTGQLAYRWEQENRNGRTTEGVGIYSGSVKWQVTPNFSLRGSAGQTYDPTAIPPATIIRTEGATALGGGFTNNGGLAPANANTEVYSILNQDIGAEQGFNYNVGMIWQTPDRRLFTSLDYFNIEVTGAPANVTAQAIGRALTGLFDGDIPYNTPIDCTSSAAQTLFNQASAALDTGAGARPVVAYRTASGAVDIGGCRAGTTLQGDPLSGDALSIAVPDRVNAGTLRVSGIDGRVQYTHPDEFFGGRIAASVDMSYNIQRYNESAQLFGVQLTAPQQLGGTDTGGLLYPVWRGNIQLTYMRGNHRFSWYSQAYSGWRSVSVNTIQNQGAYAPFNYNPDAALRTTCDTALVPLGENPALLGASGVGEGNYYSACNMSRTQGFMNKAAIISTVTYRYEMPERRANVTVSVENVFDRNPEPYGAGYGYHAAASVNSFGRNVKVGVQKTF